MHSSINILLSSVLFLTKTIFTIVLLIVIWNFVTLYQNYRFAHRSGLRYVVLPFHPYNFRWANFVGRPFLRCFNRYASSNPPVTSWRRLAEGLWPLKLRHAPFVELGTDTFLMVAPGGIVINTADADVIANIMGRPNDFPKATQLYEAIAIYGQNVVSTGGEVWRRHRKLTSPAFSERNNRLVWTTTLNRTRALLTSWIQFDQASRNLQQFQHDTMQLSLEVMGEAGLGQAISWADEDQNISDESLPSGHKMSFTASLKHVCKHIFPIVRLVQLPKMLLNYSLRGKANQEHYEAYKDWGLHMKEMLIAKKESIASNETPSSTTDIVGQLLKGQEEPVDKDYEMPLTDEEVMGNLFLFIIAGHETSASSLLLSILLLALHPSTQKDMQQELDEIFQGRSHLDWDYKRDLPRLLNGKVGAVLNEQLRLQSPALTIPKVVTSTPQQILVEGKQVTLPANAIIRICDLAVHINPKFWPHGSPQDPSRPAFEFNNPDNDLGEFKPERWATASSLNGYEPHRGAFIPFSMGQRICLGKRFAQIEVVTVIATIFSQYSIELDLSALVSDSELAGMTKEEKYNIWKQEEVRAQQEWREKSTCLVTVQLMRDVNVRLKLVKRGKERFFDLD